MVSNQNLRLDGLRVFRVPGWICFRRFHEHHALCSLSQLEYQYLFDKSAKCEPVVCPCPPWFANNSIEGTSDWHNEGGATKCPEDQSVLYGTNVTYTCPEGYVFETPQLIAFQEETSVLTLTCEKYADWSLGVKPKCIPVNCTSDPPRVNNDDRGWYDWDLAVRNKSYLHEITYSCPLKYWGFPSTGKNTKTIFCLSSKAWSETDIEKCVQLPCKEAPPPPPEGGWSWFEFDYSRYRCPNGFMFEDGSFPYWYANCSANRKWNPSKIQPCIPRTCAENPPQPFMNMVQDWPKDSLKLGTTVEYQCSVNRVTEKEQVTSQYSQCIWSKDTDELIWFPREVQPCSGKIISLAFIEIFYFIPIHSLEANTHKSPLLREKLENSVIIS
ncbi:sushi, von Willebrand factor type A, EGF and pentraxin domain-containing protein 1-like [Tigriopus californicus]|uniref:sushi, von Willebrand factor type A, EGF and pentraxin domain-containing protein 1-like n=1 Tax=Tigriopus californicus TaxID=6832 RepID=UPI0027D9D500|nr:sushi, von Willebrand factor type A, EGF and pentraxin domain-containing protein 1-like [Tigriopus californicus]